MDHNSHPLLILLTLASALNLEQKKIIDLEDFYGLDFNFVIDFNFNSFALIMVGKAPKKGNLFVVYFIIDLKPVVFIIITIIVTTIIKVNCFLNSWINTYFLNILHQIDYFCCQNHHHKNLLGLYFD